MTQRPITEPTTDEYGAEVHPAFGMIQASRVSVGGGPGSGAVLFDSDIKHGHTVRVRIHRAIRRRDLSTDWIHPGQELIEVEMSEAQWAGFVSSMNTSGVPCTLRRTENEVAVPNLDYDPRLAHSMQEVKGAAVKAFGRIREAMQDYEEAVAQKLGAKIIKERQRNLHYAIENSGANMTFAAKQLVEHTENVVQKARSDIEAMVQAEAARLGLTAGQAQGLLELPVLEGEEPALPASSLAACQPPTSRWSSWCRCSRRPSRTPSWPTST
jgi:hypothetical protein